MRLKHIRLSGFKSFVDTTKVAVPNNLIGIVGPNGCGKSNVIDAIRWVMGESSAKTLRGDSMEDVIFNGSAVRKPVNKAFVELVFDNTDGSAPGTYAKYAEIAIRRELVRDGGSKYFINKARCRRKDIQDIFLGTGLGPRSYSIIEQGMVGRIVESKPEELRVLIEEAAGISKYKERRRETENRIRHTRDNLSRVEDIVSELETQLRRLKRQANEAERYKKLKQEQRDLDVQLKTLRWSDLHSQVKERDVELERLQTEFESRVSEQRDVESQIEAMRQEQVKLSDALNEVQAEYYSIGGEVSALEQSIQHERESRQQKEQEYQRLCDTQQQNSQHLQQDEQRLSTTQTSLVDIEPQLEQSVMVYEEAAEKLTIAEQKYQSWQQEWEQLTQQAANPVKERDVQSARIEQHNRQIQHFAQRQEQLLRSTEDIDNKLKADEVDQLKKDVSAIDERCLKLEADLQQADTKVDDLRKKLEESREQYNQKRHALQDDSARLSSLRALQTAALGEVSPAVTEWIQRFGLAENDRLASALSVQAGWEKAVDAVLSEVLNAIQVGDLSQFEEQVSQLGDGSVTLIDAGRPLTSEVSSNYPRLLDKLDTADIQLDAWLYGVYIAQSTTQALADRAQLKAHESFVTQEGVCIGANWIRFGQQSDAVHGVLQREAEMDTLAASVETLEQGLGDIQTAGARLKQDLQGCEQAREQQRKDYRNQSHKRTELHNQLGRLEARSAELFAQREKLKIEQQELADQLAESQSDLLMAKKLMGEADSLATDFESRRASFAEQKRDLVLHLEQAKSSEREARDHRQAKQIELERLQSNKASLAESIERLKTQMERQTERRAELEALLQNDANPGEEKQQQLQTLLEKRLQVEGNLSQAREQLSEYEAQMQNADQQRLGFDRQSKTVRDSLESVRMQRQEIVVRRDTLSEQLEKNETQMLELAQSYDESVSTPTVEHDLSEVTRKLERIGAVNLVAIDEYEQCMERKVYLDKQHEDLTEAMATLEAAINKIDKETRTRFKETFDSLNEGFKEFFPKLFGGGSAYLELTSNDLLDTGVAVMARPPGKRNSTIHLLSGGEKALTAVSLLFAFFELNPAPFCVLDEVDAPLDDANVERYANVLKQLSDKTQLLFITHNKITMEVSDILIGVTMAEAGISRLVAVDLDEAASMALQ